MDNLPPAYKAHFKFRIEWDKEEQRWNLLVEKHIWLTGHKYWFYRANPPKRGWFHRLMVPKDTDGLYFKCIATAPEDEMDNLKAYAERFAAEEIAKFKVNLRHTTPTDFEIKTFI